MTNQYVGPLAPETKGNMSVMESFIEDQLSVSELATPLAELWLAIRADGDGIGDGSRDNPFSVNTPESFANVMRNYAGPSSTVHLGPGLFRTRGTSGNGYTLPLAKSFFAQPGQKIVGSGMFSTVLQFV